MEHVKVPVVKAFWDEAKCIDCRKCYAENICPTGAIGLARKKGEVHGPKIIINQDKCIGCSKCTRVCPGEAFSMETKYI